MILKIELPARGGRLEEGFDYADRLLAELGRCLVESECDVDHVTILFRVHLKEHGGGDPERISYSL